MAWSKFITMREIKVLSQYVRSIKALYVSAFLMVCGENKDAILYSTEFRDPNTGSNPAHSTHL